MHNNTSNKATGQEAACPVPPGGSPLPCLKSNISIEHSEDTLNLLSPYHLKASFALSENVASLVKQVGIDRLGFFTLTFPDNVTDPKEAYDRFRSLNSNYLAPHPDFGIWLCVKERQRRGAWHYHLLIDCGADVRTGVDWDEIKSGIYRSANSHLKGLWGDLRSNLLKYGFGRSELLPIRKNGDAVSSYVGKYISKHIENRKEEDKGVRLVSFSRGWPRSNTRFQWNNENSKLWRSNLASFARYVGCWDMDSLKRRFGPRWAYHFADIIISGDWPNILKKQEQEGYRPRSSCSQDEKSLCFSSDKELNKYGELFKMLVGVWNSRRIDRHSYI